GKCRSQGSSFAAARRACGPIGWPAGSAGRSRSSARTRARARAARRGRDGRRWRCRGWQLSRLELLDQGDDVTVIAHVLDEEDLLPADDHRLLGSLRLGSALDELRSALIGDRDIEDIAQDEPVASLLLKLAEVGRAIRKEHRLVEIPFD